MLPKTEYLYTPFYCEENIWQLANRLQDKSAQVVFISNASRQCALWHQQIAEPGEPVIWDYHVMLLVTDKGEWNVYDFDSLLPWGLPLPGYLEQTFNPAAPFAHQPLFRVVAVPEFIVEFSSDRRHMKDENNAWLQPPPEWPLINKPAVHNLPQYIAMDIEGPGLIYTLDSLNTLSGIPEELSASDWD